MTKAKASKAIKKPAAPAPKAPELKTIQVNAKFLRALRHIAAKADIRYYLNAVYFEATKDGGKFYVATDGHRIAALHEAWGNGEEPQDMSIILPRVVCEKATPMLEKYSYSTLKQLDAWTWTLHGKSGIHQTFKAVDAKYPEWRRVMPDAISGEPGAFNWTYLHQFNLLTKEAFGADYSVELQHNGTGAGVVTCGLHDFLGIVMPMRMSGAAMPQWAKEIQKDNAKRKAAEKLEQDKRDRAAARQEAVAA